LSDGQIAALAQHIPVVDGVNYGLPAESGDMVQRLKADIFAQRDLLAQLARESGFLFLDLTPVFQTATESGGSYYFYRNAP
jgi:hypothetical protein